MSIYLDEYKFSPTNSKMKILDIEIRQSLYRSLYMEVHLMEDNTYNLFYNFSLRSDDLIRLMTNFIKDNPKYIECSFDDLLKDKNFMDILRKEEPINIKPLSNKDVKKLINLFKDMPLKKLVKKYKSKSDYVYKVNLYSDNQNQRYICWCEVPNEWKLLEKIINICLSYIEEVNGEYHPK